MIFKDTVMAVQALWKISSLLPEQDEQNLSLIITHSAVNLDIPPVLINEQNTLVYNQIDVS